MKFHRFGFAFCTALLALSTGIAHGAIFQYSAVLSGAAEFPSNASPGVGFAEVEYDSVLHTLRIEATFSGLTGTTTAAHIHSATTLAGEGNAGVATQTPSFPGFPLGVTSGSFVNMFSLASASSWNPAYVTANGGTLASAEAAFAVGLSEGKAYFNIHTSTFGGGEIRGFLTPASTAVPDASSTVVLAGLALCSLGGFSAWSRRRRTA